MPKDTEWAYLAALIDGEGCISASPHRNGRNYNVRLSIVNTDRRCLDWCVHTFDTGTVLIRNRKLQKICYKWQVANVHKLAVILTQCLPFFTIKREQAELALERTHNPPTDRQKEIYFELKALKRANR